MKSINFGADAAAGLSQEDEDLLDTIFGQVADAVPSDGNVDTPQRDTDD